MILPLIFYRNLASRFKELLQTVVNICVNSIDKYPELKEFLERIKIYAEDLKGMKREIIMPINNDDYLRDVVLENKLLGMLINNNSQIWPPPIQLRIIILNLTWYIINPKYLIDIHFEEQKGKFFNPFFF